MTLADRLLALGTLVSALLLVALVAANWDAFQPPSQSVRNAAPVEAAATTSAPEARPATARPPIAQPDGLRVRPTRRIGAPAATAPRRTLELSAAGGQTWLEVRSGSADGELLHFGMLTAGETKTFEPLPVWVRAGAAEHLEIRLGGVRAVAPAAAPNGVVEFGVFANGVRPATP